MPMPNLRDLQSQFFASITSGREEGGPRSFDPALVQVVQGWGQLGPEERLDIYAHMYCARLLDVLHEDFPRVTALLGDKYFHEIAHRYLARYPSTHPSVRYVGRHFSEFLGAEVVMEGLPFLADLARLEWARLEVFDAPDAEPLQMAHLQAIPPEGWPALRFRLIPACQILRSAWPVHRVWAAQEETPLYELASPAETVVRVWREGFTVYQASLNTAERLGLDCVLAREPFAAICAALEPVLPAETVTHEVGGLLMRWIEDGILERLPEY
jgi:hypothetical protein